VSSPLTMSSAVNTHQSGAALYLFAVNLFKARQVIQESECSQGV